MKLDTLHGLFVHKIQAIYDAEKQITETMPTLIDLCSSQTLKSNMKKHLTETEKQIEKLEKLCDEMNIELEGPSNLAMEGMIDDTMELISDSEPSPILDAAIISAAQAVEHYEISCYGTAAEWADLMSHDNAKEILGEILTEEKATDELLTQMAKDINEKAMQMAGSIPMGRMG